MGLSVTASAKYVVSLETIFTVISEGAVFKMSDGAEDVVFNENGIYKKIVDSRSPVDITGDKEAKGSLRILKSALGDSLNPYLNYDGKEASAGKPIGELDAYQQRVSTLFKLNSVDFDMLMNHKNVEETQPAERNKGAENTICTAFLAQARATQSSMIIAMTKTGWRGLFSIPITLIPISSAKSFQY